MGTHYPGLNSMPNSSSIGPTTNSKSSIVARFEGATFTVPLNGQVARAQEVAVRLRAVLSVDRLTMRRAW